ncbi:hypothetical protein FJZ23_00050 [Candidatus Parcubacteria bacterium]|nr:hypothetical protein [Candidatus Parcubacteria bacterium]
MGRNLKTIALLCLMTLLGAGCVSLPVSQQSPEAAAAGLQLTPGSELVLRGTVFGLGGKFVKLFKQENADTRLLLDHWEAGAQARATWERVLKRETEESKKATQDYYAQYASAPIGTKAPEPPEPVYVTHTETGILETEALSNATSIHLPLFWIQGQTGGQGSGLIWLSQTQYRELFETRKTDINLGLFDDSVSYAIGLTDHVKSLVERLRGSTEPPEEQNVLEVKADINWGEYVLTVDGVSTTVQAIRAQNAFARYTILANEQNPLILEIMVSPATRGSLNLFTRDALGKAFWGYEVVSITRADAPPSADPPQP